MNEESQLTSNEFSEVLAQIYRYKPSSISAVNHNDLRSFVHEWFAAFDHTTTAEYFLNHLDFGTTAFNMDGKPLAHDAESFRLWYADALRHIPWDFHDILHIRIEGTAVTNWTAQFFFRHVGEHRANASSLEVQPFHRILRADWSLRHDGSSFIIQQYELTTISEEIPIR